MEDNMNAMPKINIVTIDYHQYLSASEIKSIEHEVSIMETREAAGIEALKIVQEHRGWVSDDSLYAIADLLNMPEAELEGVATFYNLIYRQEVGQFVIHLCDSVACHLTGYQQIYQKIKAHLGIDYGQTTPDGKFTFLTNVCLGGCDKAPSMMIGKQHYQYLTTENVIDILNDLAKVTESHNEESSDSQSFKIQECKSD
jgi:NADH-quinone oxidoreductase subunit E